MGEEHKAEEGKYFLFKPKEGKITDMPNFDSFFEGMMKFQYGSAEEKDSGFQQMKEAVAFNDEASATDFKASRNRFIGGLSLEEVIASDTKELEEIGSSFKVIADRMEYFQSRIFHIVGNHVESNKQISYKTCVIEDVNFLNGPQCCPFSDCDFLGMNDIKVTNTKTGRQLVINDITIHLASFHSLLEKGNQYGISAKEFYEHFM